jgi:hypothetical protein
MDDEASKDAQAITGIDFGAGESISVYLCVCGFRCSTGGEILEHLKTHIPKRRHPPADVTNSR